jgi:TPR repeat protein
MMPQIFKIRSAVLLASAALALILGACVAEEKTAPPVMAKPAAVKPATPPAELARQYLQGEGRKADPAKGIAILEAAAKEGDPESQYLLGFAYKEGQHVPRDRVRALNLFENAAVREHAQAAFLAAVSYREGEIVPADPEKSATYMKIAADGDVVEALYLTAEALEQGNGLDKDPIKAKHYYERAAEHGNLEATIAIAKAYETGDGVPLDLAWSLRWHERAAHYGYLESQFTFGTNIWAGNGLPVNQSEGLKWLLIAARSGHADSRRAIPRHRGRTSPQDSRAARIDAKGWKPVPEGVMQGIDIATVRFVQAALNQMGIPSGGVDGKNGPSTTKAVNNFRLIRGVPPVEKIDLESVRLIRDERRRQTTRQARN